MSIIKNNVLKNKTISNTLLFVALIALLVSVWGFMDLRRSYSSIKSDFASSTAYFENKVLELENSLKNLQIERDGLFMALEEERNKTDDLQDEQRKSEKKIDTLEKLTTIDPQLLQKYSKVYFLNENYVPAELKDIPRDLLFDENKPQQIHAEVWPFLDDLTEAAEDDGVNLRIVSGYRSFDTQQSLKANYSVTYGAGTANQFSADQGYSEHQLGTTVDFTTEELGANYSNIDSTEAFDWLQKNAYRYGFILSYPKGNSYYVYEPWHWRFVGESLSRYLHKNDLNFYDLDQRKIDEYKVKLFD